MRSGRGLGPMERKIMEYIWCRDSATVAQVHRYLAEQREVAYTTIMTIMFRLVGKGFLNREKYGRAYLYQCTKSKGVVVSHLVHNAFESLVNKYGIEAIKAFAEEIDRLPATKRAKLLKEILKDNSKGDGLKSMIVMARDKLA